MGDDDNGCVMMVWYALGLFVLVWLSYSAVGQQVMLYLR